MLGGLCRRWCRSRGSRLDGGLEGLVRKRGGVYVVSLAGPGGCIMGLEVGKGIMVVEIV